MGFDVRARGYPPPASWRILPVLARSSSGVSLGLFSMYSYLEYTGGSDTLLPMTPSSTTKLKGFRRPASYAVLRFPQPAIATW